jgi:phosphohistidine phosphatase
MLTLLLMRHAKSSWDEPGVSDHDRPLNARGARAAPRMGRLLREKALVPELIVSSTAKRAVDTAHAVADAMGYTGPIEVTRRLYLAEPEGYLDLLAEALLEGETAARDRRVLIIGHNPGLAQLVALLTGVDVEMQTAAIAHVEADVVSGAALTPGCGSLRGVYRPKELD